nr:MAG TPA: hypothetical protein [Caudoviricetes sp.]
MCNIKSIKETYLLTFIKIIRFLHKIFVLYDYSHYLCIVIKKQN